jgi:hypothetical protein
LPSGGEAKSKDGSFSYSAKDIYIWLNFELFTFLSADFSPALSGHLYSFCILLRKLLLMLTGLSCLCKTMSSLPTQLLVSLGFCMRTTYGFSLPCPFGLIYSGLTQIPQTLAKFLCVIPLITIILCCVRTSSTIFPLRLLEAPWLTSLDICYFNKLSSCSKWVTVQPWFVGPKKLTLK